MKKFFNILAKLLVIILIAFISIVVLVISVDSEKIPEIYAFSTSAEAKALMGNYKWYAFSNVMEENSFSIESYVFKNENTLLVSPNEKITIANSATRRNFSPVSFEFYDSNGNKTIVPSEQQSNSYAERNYLEFTVPEKEDTYYYYFKLRYYEKGEVEYALKVIVSTEPVYDIEQLQKYRNTSLFDSKSIRELLSLLAYSRNITNLLILPSEYDYRLIIKYSEISVDRSSFYKNAIALFALIPEMKTLEFSSPNDVYIFTREEIEIIQGRNVVDYAFDKELWENEVLYNVRVNDENNSKDIIFSKIVEKVLNLESGEILDEISFDTKSFDEYTTIDFTEISRYKFLSDMQRYCRLINDIPFTRYASLQYNHIFICAESAPKPVNISGDMVSGDITSNLEEVNSASGETSSVEVNMSGWDEIRIFMRKDNTDFHFIFYVKYEDGEWKIDDKVSMVI